MGFSRYCPSSLDLTNFVVQSRRGVVCRLSLADSLESGNMGIWKSRSLEIQESRNPEIWKSRNLEIQESGISGIPKEIKKKRNNYHNANPFCPKCGQGFVMAEKGVPAPFGAFRAIFCVGRKNRKKKYLFCLFSLVGPWALFTRFGALAAIHPRWE